MIQMIQKFQKLLVGALNSSHGLSLQGRKTACEISRRLELEATFELGLARPNPLNGDLNFIAERIDELPDDARMLADMVIKLSDQLPWYQRSAPDFPVFEAGHANAEIIGPKGMVIRTDVIVGVTIMRPGTIYPDHHHIPEEIYVVLSEGQWRQQDNPWKTPGPGGYVYNPSDILHAMKSENTPLFAVWCLKP